MTWISVCPFCHTNTATEEHHKFSQTKQMRKIYGALIDAPFNKIKCCNGCNGSHRNIPEWAKWNERRFRLEALKLGYELPPGSKSYQQKWGD